ncbi:MAG: hypothetical protein WAM44_04480 [Chthoniobacterales bacterium]
MRGRGEQRLIITRAIRRSTLCIAPIEDVQRDAISRARLAPNSSQPVDDRAHYDEGLYLLKFPCSPRPRKRGNAPGIRLQAAFSLVEVLASLFILTLSAVGITAAWRLADYQELLTRLDSRAERILRQYYELQTFGPPDSRPFTVNEPSQQTPITGYLYHPRLIAGQTGTGSFGNLIPFSVSMTNGTPPGTSELVLTYTVPSYGTQASRQMTKTVLLNP